MLSKFSTLEMRGQRMLRYLLSAYHSLENRYMVISLRARSLWNRLGMETFCKRERRLALYLVAALLMLYGMVSSGYHSSFWTDLEMGTDEADYILGDESNSTACDIFNGRWVYDTEYPLYTASVCPFAEKGFRCQNNGRRDKDYMRWRWQPYNCDVPRFNAFDILKRLNGMRVVFVGDSMARTQWESLICLLMQGVIDKKSVYEVNGSKITKRIPYLGVKFSTFNFTVEYYRSAYMVKQSHVRPKRVPKRVKSTLLLDKPDPAYSRSSSADILIFNTGHWWVPGKTFDMGCYFQVGESLKLGMRIIDAYEKALHTWASWVQNAVNTSKTHVFFRTFEPSHWQGSYTRRVCRVTRKPLESPGKLGRHPFSQALRRVVYHNRVPINILNITTLSAYRSDAHVGKWSDAPTVPDCSHWCLPGVPDIWNELLFGSLMMKGQGVWGSNPDP